MTDKVGCAHEFGPPFYSAHKRCKHFGPERWAYTLEQWPVHERTCRKCGYVDVERIEWPKQAFT